MVDAEARASQSKSLNQVDDNANVQIFAFRFLAKDPVIGMVASDLIRNNCKSDLIIDKVESEFPGTEIQERNTAALDVVWEKLLSDEPIYSTYSGVQKLCTCTYEELIHNTPDNLIDYLLYCHPVST